MKRYIKYIAVIIAFDFVTATATVIHVPGDYPTIQQGIDACSDGDTVLVQPGTYVENINFNGHNIVLGSMFLTTGDNSYISTTVIDGNGSGSVVTFENGEDNAVVITGFTIQNGFSMEGGGIYCLSSDPTIRYNIISGNSSESDGGGIYCDDSDPVIFRNTISGNSNYEGTGGGIYCRNNSSPNIYGNTVTGNSTTTYGGGIFCSESSPGMTNNTISMNSAGVSGGGIYCELVSNPVITNTIFWADSASYESEIDFDDSSSPYFTYCDIQGGWGGEGNIDTDPLFRDPENGDFHLMADSCGDVYNSPCIDTGDPAIFDSMLGCDWGLGLLRSDMGVYGGAQIPTDVDEEQTPEIPMQFLLSQNYPNPFNASTVIRYSLPQASDVKIAIYDILGRKVETLVQEDQPAGYHHVTWDASNQSSGLYFYRIQAGEYAETRKMVLLK